MSRISSRMVGSELLHHAKMRLLVGMSLLRDRREKSRSAGSWGRRRVDGVVPLAVEGVRLEVHECEFLVRDSAALRIGALIESAAHGEALLGRCGGDQVHDDLMGNVSVRALFEGSW